MSYIEGVTNCTNCNELYDTYNGELWGGLQDVDKLHKILFTDNDLLCNGCYENKLK